MPGGLSSLTIGMRPLVLDQGEGAEHRPGPRSLTPDTSGGTIDSAKEGAGDRKEYRIMTRDEAIAEARRRQASDPDASWIAASRDGDWTVARIVKRDAPQIQPPPRASHRAARSRSGSLGSGIWGWPPPGGLG
jgi:hypothetical protein